MALVRHRYKWMARWMDRLCLLQSSSSCLIPYISSKQTSKSWAHEWNNKISIAHIWFLCFGSSSSASLPTSYRFCFLYLFLPSLHFSVN